MPFKSTLALVVMTYLAFTLRKGTPLILKAGSMSQLLLFMWRVICKTGVRGQKKKPKSPPPSLYIPHHVSQLNLQRQFRGNQSENTYALSRAKPPVGDA